MKENAVFKPLAQHSKTDWIAWPAHLPDTDISVPSFPTLNAEALRTCPGLAAPLNYPSGENRPAFAIRTLIH